MTTGGATFTNVTGQSTYGWGAPAGNCYCMTNSGAGSPRFVVGDRVFVSSDHTETGSNNYNWVNANAFGLLQILSVNRAGSVPPVAADALAGATISGAATGNLTMDAACNIYYQGVTLTFAAGSGNVNIFFGNGFSKKHYLRNCTISLGSNTGSGSRVGTNNPTAIVLDNTTVQFGAVGQGIQGGQFQFNVTWLNTSSAIAGATIPTNLFISGSNNNAFLVTLRGVDLSALSTALLSGNTTQGTKLLLDSCRVNASVNKQPSAGFNTPEDEIELVACYDGTTTNIAERHTPAGDLTTNRSTTMVGGAQDDSGLFSHRLVSSTRSDFLTLPLESFWMDVENTVTGSSRTATVEIVSSASLNNTDISLQLEYLGTSGSSLASFGNSLPSALTASAAVPTSTATWNSPPGTPVYQHLQVTFTPQTAGRLRGIVRLGKPSTTVWVNPQITVT